MANDSRDSDAMPALTGVTSLPSVLGGAIDAAERSARRAGVNVLELRTPAETERAAELLREVWRAAEPPVPANLLRTVQHTGGYAYGAYDASGQLLGVALGLLATGHTLHSHITGVVPAGQRRGLGLALKQHQRGWALRQGMQHISWTCDPLVRRNLAFNLHALGAQIAHYLPNHYGPMTDGINVGEDSDRFELLWDLTSAHAEAAQLGRLPLLDLDLPASVADVGGRPVSSVISGPRLVSLPRDIESLRTTDRTAAGQWRRAVRDAVVPALAEGLVVRGVSTSGALVLTASDRSPNA